MKIFFSPQTAIQWADEACESPFASNRIHGPFSFLAADRLGATARFTCGSGLTARAEDWSRRKGVTL